MKYVKGMPQFFYIKVLILYKILEKLSKVKDVRNYIREIVNPDGESILFNKDK